MQLRCVATQNEEHVALRMSSTDPLQRGSLSMDRGSPTAAPSARTLVFAPKRQAIRSAPGICSRCTSGSREIFSCSGRSCTTRFVALHNELGHDGACHGHDRQGREISHVLGADEAHPSVLLRFRPATMSQTQQLRCRLVHVDDAGRCTLYSVTQYIKRNRSLSMCVVHVMAGGMPASISQAPLLRQPRHHPAEHPFQEPL